MCLLEFTLSLDQNWRGNRGHQRSSFPFASFLFTDECFRDQINQTIVFDVAGRRDHQIARDEVPLMKFSGGRTIKCRHCLFGAFDRAAKRMIREVSRVKKLSQ